MDDRALVAATLDGDRTAFGTLVDRETVPVYRACLRILRDAHEAEDAAQEAFVTAFRALGSYRGEGSLRSWLLRIATRLSFKRLGQRRPVTDLAAVPQERLADPVGDPATLAIRAERRDDVRDAVARLPDAYREVVALRFFGELSLLEIADATGRPLNTVKTQLRRGLERLRPLAASEEAR